MASQLMRNCLLMMKGLQGMGRIQYPVLLGKTNISHMGHIKTIPGFYIQSLRAFGSVYEPEYLDPVGHQVPKYDFVNIQLKSYDFSVLESFQAFVHKTIERIGQEVEDGWGIPAQKFRITKLKPESTVIETEYHLNMYERTVQIADIPTTMLPILINIVEAALPVGVTMNVKQHEDNDTEIRFIPDLELKELKEQLTLDTETLKKRKIRFKLNFK